MTVNRALCAILLTLATSPAHAAGWSVDYDTEGEFGEGLDEQIYFSDLKDEVMAAGEFARLLYTRTAPTQVTTSSGVALAANRNHFRLTIGLTSGDQAITGFSGVSLAAKDIAADTRETLYMAKAPGADEQAAPSSSRNLCNVGGYYSLNSDGFAQCTSLCFRNRDDYSSSRNPVACGSGEAHWIKIEIEGAYLEIADLPPSTPADSPVRKAWLEIRQQLEAFAAKNGPVLSRAEKMRRADILLFHINWKGAAAASIPIDDVFRTALWNPKK